VYVLGDNRAAAKDSRYWGPVPLESVLGSIDAG
jgi:type IV secretory pathway protease TraF